MNASPDDRRRWQALAESACRNELSTAERDELEQLLRDDGEGAAFIVAYLDMHAQIVWDCRADSRVPGLPFMQGGDDLDETMTLLGEVIDQQREVSAKRAEAQAKMAAERREEESARRDRLRLLLGEPGNVKPVRHIVIPRAAVYAAVAAMAAMLLLVVYSMRPDQPTPPSETDPGPRAVATIIGAVDARFADGSSTDAGTQLFAGAMHLAEGRVELSLDGTRLVVEAPCELVLQSVRHVRLNRGRIAGHVPPHARGFTINTPGATVIDLGTAFGIEVTAQRTDVQVFEGEVEAALSDATGAKTESIRLRANEAARLDGETQQITAIAPLPARFARSLDQERGLWLASRRNRVNNGAIQIDGSFDDWSGVEPFPADAAGDATADPQRSVDFVQCAIAHDATCLYIMIHQANAVAFEGPSHWTVLDTDLDPATGFHGKPPNGEATFEAVGGEFNVQREAGLNIWSPAGEFLRVVGWEDDPQFRFAVSADRTRIEFAVPLRLLNDPGQLHVIWVGENRAGKRDGDAGVNDYYPDAATDPAGSFFRYELKP